jgi:hypothetical protein
MNTASLHCATAGASLGCSCRSCGSCSAHMHTASLHCATAGVSSGCFIVNRESQCSQMCTTIFAHDSIQETRCSVGGVVAHSHTVAHRVHLSRGSPPWYVRHNLTYVLPQTQKLRMVVPIKSRLRGAPRTLLFVQCETTACNSGRARGPFATRGRDATTLCPPQRP